MIALDTNVVVRVITRDDPEQAALAADRMRDAQLWLAKTVLLETEWVLRHAYGHDATSIGRALRILVGLDNLQVEDPGAVLRALRWHDAGMDFADAIHLASSGNADSFVTFDTKLASAVRHVDLAPDVELLGR